MSQFFDFDAPLSSKYSPANRLPPSLADHYVARPDSLVNSVMENAVFKIHLRRESMSDEHYHDQKLEQGPGSA